MAILPKVVVKTINDYRKLIEFGKMKDPAYMAKRIEEYIDSLLTNPIWLHFHYHEQFLGIGKFEIIGPGHLSEEVREKITKYYSEDGWIVNEFGNRPLPSENNCANPDPWRTNHWRIVLVLPPRSA